MTVRGSFPGEIVKTDISGYGKKIAFQIFITVVVHIAYETKKSFLRQIIGKIGVAGLVTAEAVNVLFFYHFSEKTYLDNPLVCFPYSIASVGQRQIQAIQCVQ